MEIKISKFASFGTRHILLGTCVESTESNLAFSKKINNFAIHAFYELQSVLRSAASLGDDIVSDKIEKIS